MPNNPALTLVMVATLKGFPFQWPMGADNLLLVSLGTGYPEFKKHVGEIDDATMLTWASNIPDMLMQDASWQNQVVLQWISNSPTAHYIDMEMEDLKGDLLAEKPLIKYLRYNFPITENDLNELGIDKNFNKEDVDDLVEMSNAKNREILYEIGYKASDKIASEHFNLI